MKTPIWATFFGGGANYNGADWGTGIATLQNKLYLVGVTQSVSPTIPLADIGGGSHYCSSLTGSEHDGFCAYFSTSVLPMSVDENEFINDKAHIYPNPSNGHIYLSIDHIAQNTLEVNVYSTTGTCIFTKNYDNIAPNSVIQIDLSSYSNGLYLVYIISEEGVFSEKLILQ